LNATNIRKSYPTARGELSVLNGVTLALDQVEGYLAPRLVGA
jgi:hypothetical protein